jgi:transposase InsO family protein
VGLIQYCIAAITLNLHSILDPDSQSAKRPRIAGKVNGTDTTILIDSGASISVISDDMFKSIYKHWEAPKLPMPDHIKLTGITGHAIQVMDYVELEVSMLGRQFKRPMLVVSGLNLTQVVAGWDTIRQEGIIIDGENGRVYLKDGETKEDGWAVASLLTPRTVTIGARTVQKISVMPTVGNRRLPTGQTGICQAISPSPLGVWDSLAEVGTNGEVIVSVINMLQHAVLLEPGDSIGTMRNPEYFEEEISDLNEETVNAVFGNIGEEPKEPKQGESEERITPEERRTLEQRVQVRAQGEFRARYLRLIMQYHDVCSKTKFDLGFTDVIKHSIRMENDVPIHSRQFRVPFEHEQMLHDYVDELLKKGAIEVSRSPYNSPIFCVAKKIPPNHVPGTPLPMRVVLDYRKVNASSLPDRYSIREIREYVDEVGRAGSKIFSAVDLTAGFWQQSLEKESREYSAFTVPGKGTRYQWMVTPMGLQGSPASFARLMDFIMRGLKGVLTYIDDVLVHTLDHEAHLVLLESTLLRLRRYGLKLNVDKSIFGTTEVQYLGYTLSDRGVSPSEDKVETIKEFKAPRNVKQVREFIGLCNYFRFLIKGFSRMAATLTALTKKETKWQGGELPAEAQRSFDSLKTQLCGTPVVAYPRKDIPFILHTDGASGDPLNPGGLGAVLLQEQDGEERVIAYASRGLKTHEKNYSAYLLELTAAVFGIEHFDVYLRGRRFALFTDHKPLEKLNAVHKKTLNRLQQQMCEYEFTMHYKRGEDNAVADFLSRNAILSKTEDEAGKKSALAALSTEDQDTCDEQENDTKIRDVKEYLKSGKLPTLDKKYAMWIRRISDECFLENDIVWKQIKRRGFRERTTLYAPERIRDKLIQAAHVTREAGHGGNHRTMERIMLSYWWPGISQDVDKFVRRCGRCQTAKALLPPPAPLQSMPICMEPNMTVHMDLLGPLKTSGAGKKYIMVLTDAFTKYAEVIAIENKEAPTIARCFFEKWICRFSSPARCITDQGKEFCNKLLDEVCKIWGVEKARTSPFHPQTNSSAESYNRTIIKYMRAILDNCATLEWEEMLPSMMLAYNTHIHRSTKESPFFLTFAHDPRLPYFDIAKPKVMYHDNYATESFREVQIAFKTAYENMDEARQIREEYYNRKTKERSFQAGERVIVYFPNVPTGVNQKFYKRWRLFTIMKQVGPVNVLVRENSKKKAVIVHVNRVRHASIAEIEEHCDSTAFSSAEREEPENPKFLRSRARTQHFEEEEEEEESGSYEGQVQGQALTQQGGPESPGQHFSDQHSPGPLSPEEEEESEEEQATPEDRDYFWDLAKVFYPRAAAATTRRQTRSRGAAAEEPWVSSHKKKKTKETKEEDDPLHAPSEHGSFHGYAPDREELDFD